MTYYIMSRMKSAKKNKPKVYLKKKNRVANPMLFCDITLPAATSLKHFNVSKKIYPDITCREIDEKSTKKNVLYKKKIKKLCLYK